MKIQAGFASFATATAASQTLARAAGLIFCLVCFCGGIDPAAQNVVTKRFGDARSCDVTTVTQDGVVDADNPGSTHDVNGQLYFRWNYQALLRFDLSSIPPGTHVRRAVLRFIVDENYYDGDTKGESIPLVKLKDPAGTGLWDASQMTFNQKRTGVPWSASGNIATAKGEQIGAVYFKNWLQEGNPLLEADITTATQGWVNQPAGNFGFVMACVPMINKRIASHLNGNPDERPYLEVTYEKNQDQTIAPPTQAKALFSDGQTFLTWKEAATGKDETSYRIYRSPQPITTANLDAAEFVDEVWQGSSYLSDTIAIKQPDLSSIGVTLSEDSGLYVYTAQKTQAAYYAVTTVIEGNENRAIAGGSNATATAANEKVGLPRPFFFNRHAFGYYTGLVVWLGRFNSADPSDAYGYDSRKSAPFFFSVAEPMEYSATRIYPLTLFLHASGQNYFASEEGRDNSRYYTPDAYGGYTIQINDRPQVVVKKADNSLLDLGPFFEFWAEGYSFYTGWNSNYEPNATIQGFRKSFNIAKPFEQGKNVMYTEKSMRYVVDWMRHRSPWAAQMDPNRLYLEGGSMGGCGGLSFALHNPDLVTALDLYIGRTALYVRNAYWFGVASQFGTKEMGITTPDGANTYSYLDMAAYLRAHPTFNYPAIRMRNGKLDETVVWSTQPDFYKAAQEVGIYLNGYFDQGGHTSGDPDADFPEYADRRFFPRDQALPYFNPFQFRANGSYPAFTNFSLNDNPGNGNPANGDLRGGINRFIRWDNDTLQDDLKHWAATVYLYDFSSQPAATVTIIPRNAQNLVQVAGSQYAWRMTRESDGTVLQSGTVAPDSMGRIRINALQVSKERRRLILDLAATSDVTAPATPGGVSAALQGQTSALVKWSASTDNVAVAGYRISRDSVGAVKTVTATQGLIEGLLPGVTYNFTVTAFDAAGNESAPSQSVQIVTPGVSGNRPPVFAAIPTQNVNRGDIVSLTSSATDPDDFNLTYSMENLPVGARFDPDSQEFRWLPNYQQSGAIAVTFVVTDGVSIVKQSVTINVSATAPQPEIQSVQTYGAFVSGGVNLKISKADGNEVGKLFIKKHGEADTAYHEGHFFVRYDVNHMATSLFDLDPNTQYDLKIQLIDPETQTREATATLTTRPEWSLPAPTRQVNVANDAQLAAAIAAAIPGDHILLAPGTYAAQVNFDGKFGIAGKPIVIRSKDLGNRALLTGGLNVRTSGYVTVYGLELNGGGGLKIRGSRHAEVVQNNIRDAGGTGGSYLVHISHNELIDGADKNFYALIMNNELTDDNNSNTLKVYGEFPDQTYYGIKQDDGVGGMTIIRGNIIRGVADGISSGGDEGETPVLGPDDFDFLDTWPNQNLDIYDNKIYLTSDDGIETDGHTVNGRIFHNTIGFCMNSISCATVFPGPMFILRNTLYGYREQPFKLNTAVLGITRNVYFYHNTIKQQPLARYALYRGTPTQNQDIFFRNNLIVATGRVIDTDIGSNYAGEWYHKNHDYDYDLYWSPLPQNAGFTLFKWGFSDWDDNHRYESFAAFQAATANPNEFVFTAPGQRLIPEEVHGKFADPLLVLKALADFPATSLLVSLTPAVGSPAIDAGVRIFGINDKYMGARPDMGAVESQGDAPVEPPPLTVSNETQAPLLLDYADTVSAPPGSYVTLWGTGFGSGPPAGLVYIGNVAATEYAKWTENRIDFQIPAGATSSDLCVKVGTAISTLIPFTVRGGGISFVEGNSSSASDENPGTQTQPWKTIGRALAQAHAGDTVYVGDGTYQERIIPVNAGSANLPIMFKARPGTRPIIDGATLTGRPDGIHLEGSGMGYYTFAGFDLINFKSAVAVLGATHCRFFDLTGSYSRGGFYLYGGDSLFMGGSRFHHNQDYGVSLNAYASKIELQDCIAEQNGSFDGGGFEAEFTVQNLTLRRCASNNNAGEGFDIKAGAPLLAGCSASQNTAGYTLWQSGRMENCEALRNATFGISLGRLPDDSPVEQIVNCTVAGAHASPGIDVKSGVVAAIVNTISAGGLSAALRYVDVQNAPLIDHCVFQTSGPIGTPTVQAGSSFFNAGQVNGGLLSPAITLTSFVLAGIDPVSLFENYSGGNLKLSSASRARDYGTNVNAPAIDRLRRPRGQRNGLYDVGAYEYSFLDNAAGAAWTMYR